MHMADALLSPAVGGTMWAVTTASIAYCSKKIRNELDDRKVPLMGVAGAFVFAAQMINFTIPATGSSGHLAGGLLLAILLGPYAGFLTIASVIAVQALFFADGGLLALGANIFNMGFLGCFVAYPFIYRPLAGRNPASSRRTLAAVAASVAALQLGPLCVVVETVASGISALPVEKFLWLMLPIHLPIGLVEGLVTAALVNFVWKAQPDLLPRVAAHQPLGRLPVRKVLVGLGVAAALTGGILSWFASAHPDGLEWSIAGVTGAEEVQAPADAVHETLGALQEKTSFLPDYGFKASDEGGEEATSWPAVDPATSISGLVGGVITLLAAFGLGWLLRRRAATA